MRRVDLRARLKEPEKRRYNPAQNTTLYQYRTIGVYCNLRLKDWPSLPDVRDLASYCLDRAIPEFGARGELPLLLEYGHDMEQYL